MTLGEINPGAASIGEAELFRDIAQKWAPLVSDEISRIDFRYGESSDGSPAVWITVVVPADLRPSKDKINALNRATESIRKDILEADTDRWPYVKIETE